MAAQIYSTAASILPRLRWAYVGSRTEDKAQGKGISVFRMDTASGSWTPVEVLGEMVNPSFLALDRTGQYLYTVHGTLGGITAFRIDRQTGRLTQISHQATMMNPVHLAADATNRYMIVANLGSNVLALHALHADGTLGPMFGSVMPPQHKSETGQVQKPKPHQCTLDPSGRYIVVPDKGVDRVFVYRISEGKLVLNDTPSAVAQPGAGPRHVDFHPKGSWAYVVNELNSTITAYHFDAQSGALTTLQTLSTLPPDFKDKNKPAEVYVTPNGKFVYASNRGHNSLAIFAIDPLRGTLTLHGWEPTQGRTPRYFCLDPTGTFLYAANENGHNVVTFQVDQENGKLTPTGQVVSVGSPVCIVFADYVA